MAEQQPVPKPIGHAQAWPPALLDRMSRVSAQDMMRARELWKKHAPRGLGGLIDARVKQ